MLGETLPGDGVGLTTNGKDSLNGDVHDHETLGTQSIRKDLECVSDEETRPGECVEDTEDPDAGNLDVTSSLVGLARVLVDGGGDGPADEGHAHTGGGGQEERTTTNLVDEGSGIEGHSEIQDTFTGRESKLLVLVLDTGTCVDKVDVVGEQSVTGVLRDNTEGDENSEPPSVTLGPDEVQVARVRLSILLHSDGLPHLLVGELDSRVVAVALSVVIGKHRFGLLVALLGDEPTWGFGDPPDEAELECGWQTLEQSDGPPRPLVGNVGCSPANESDEQGSQIPETIVYGGKSTTMLRMADLGKENGRAHLSEGVTETEDEAASEVDLPVGREARDQSTSNHDNAASSDRNLAANSLGEEGHGEEADDGTNVVGVVHETQAVVIGMVKVDLPARHLLRGVHHHTSVLSARSFLECSKYLTHHNQ